MKKKSKSINLKKVRKSDDYKPLSELSPRKIGKKIGLTEMLEQYVLPSLNEKKRRPSTVGSLKREVRRFEQWREEIGEKISIAKINRKTLEDYRIWLASQDKSKQLRNGASQAVMQVLNTAYKHGFIKQAPKLESLSVNNAAPKVYPSDEEIDCLMGSCKIATWPKKDRDKNKLPYSPEVAWRVTIALYRTFGFRTQELVQLENDYRPLTWENIYAPGLTPNVVGRGMSEHGFLMYTPQKQERCKPNPLVIPLPATIRAALNLVSQGPMHKDSPVLNFPLSAVTFRKQLRAIFTHAGVFPRRESKVKYYTAKHFRKSASTIIELHRPGLAKDIVGHGEGRDGQSAVSAKHYINSEAAIFECVETMPLPSSFQWFLDQN